MCIRDRILVDERTSTLILEVEEENQAQIIGKNGQNLRLMTHMIGWSFQVLNKVQFKEYQDSSLVEKLDGLAKRLNISEKEKSGIISKELDSQFYLDIIGTSHCRSRTIACTKDQFLFFKIWKQAKSNVITCHQKWIDSIEKQKQAMKTGLKAYRYLSEGVELMTELGIEIDEAELVRVNSTGLTIYNPVNLASMIKGMKNTTMTREQKIALRMEYEKKESVN